MILFLAVTARQQTVAQKIKNFLTKWRQVQQRIPLPEMTELRITPPLPEYPKIARDVFMLLLDGKLRSRTETLKFLKPFAPPPPPPPPPPRRGRGPKAAAAAPAAAAVAGKKGDGAGEREGSGCGGCSCFSDSWASCEGKVQGDADGDQSSGQTSEHTAKPAAKHPAPSKKPVHKPKQSQRQRRRARSGKIFRVESALGGVLIRLPAGTKFSPSPASDGHIIAACIDRFSSRRSCCCWPLCHFRRSTAEGMRPVADMPGLLRTAVGFPATPALRLSVVHTRVLVSRHGPSRPRSASRSAFSSQSFNRASTAALTVPVAGDSGPMASEEIAITTATDVWAPTGIHGDMRARSIRIGGGIRARRMTRISNIRLAWRTR